MEEKIEYTDTINYVVTTQPDLVAGYIDELNERIAELEQELAELKEKVIVPKFNIGQEVWSIFISDYFRDCKEICNLEITAIMKCNNGIYYLGYVLEQCKNRSDYWFNEENTFFTKQEAQAKLKEIQGNE